MIELRPLGTTDVRVSAIALGCWPISGMTSLHVTRENSLATLAAALDCGVTHWDSAYCYGADGESDRLIAEALTGRRDRVTLASKCGIHWGSDGKQARDARPATIRAQCETSLRRLQTDYVDLLYLHAPDPATPIADSAGEFARLLAEGKTRAVGASNCSVQQLAEFHAVCPLAACQPHYNMLQREIEADVLPWCVENNVSVLVYWPLMKGLLAGQLARDHVFAPQDGRAKYPMFQGGEYQKNQDFLDVLRSVAAECGRTVSQVVLNWTIHRPGVTAALCGAKRPEQVRDNAGGTGWRLSAVHLARIAAGLQARGPVVSRAAVT